jgi:hypothetical protein
MRDVAEQEVIGVLPNRDPAGSRIMIVETSKFVHSLMYRGELLMYRI